MRRRKTGLKSFFLQLAGLGWVGFLFCWLLAQEEPTGSLRIRVIAKDTQQPLARVRVWRQQVGGEQEAFYMMSNSRGWIWRRKVPVGQYEITSAYGGGYQLEKASPRFEALEGRETTLTLELTPLPPYVYFSVPQRQFSPQQKVQVDCYGHSREKQLHLYLYKVPPLQYLLNAPSEGYEGTPFGQKPGEIGLKEALKGSRLIKDWSIPLKLSSASEDPFSFQIPISLPNLPRGLYILIGNLGNLKTSIPLLISNLGLICKQAPDHLLLYAQSISNNQPQPKVHLYLLKNKRERIRGITNARGLWEWLGPLGQTPLVFAQHGEDIAWLQSGVYSAEEQEKYRLYLFTERPLYRPGQRVFFKGVVCSLADNRYRVAPGQKVTVQIRDAQDSLVWKKEFTTNARGSFWGFFPLGTEVALGNWRLVGNIFGKTQETSFGVAEYRKPEYQVEVSTDKKEYIRGEDIRVKGLARYYWGGPVAKAKVNYTVTGSDYWFYPNAGGTPETFFPYEESRIYGQEIANGQVITDEKGDFSFWVPTQKVGAVLSEFQDQLFQIEVEVTDPAERSVSRSIHCLVARGEMTLFLKTENYVYSLGDLVHLSLLVTDLKGKKQEGVPIDLWVTPPPMGKGVIRGGQRRHVKTQLEEKETFHTTSDAEGRGIFRFPVGRQGEWTLTATVRDQRGNRVSTRLQLWVVEGTFRDPSYSYPELALQWNKKAFHPGEIAKVLINTSARNLYALISLEGPRIFWWKQIFLKGGTSLFQFPVREEYLPNAYLNVCFAKGKKFVQQSIPLKIALDRHLLEVKISSDKLEYRPRERANFTITCRDAQGKPTQAEVSLGIVDEAVYGVLEEQRPDIAQVIYGERENQVQTLYSFPEIYYSGGAKEGSIRSEVRRWFPDTWRWLPDLITNKEGQVHLQLTVPDTLTTWRLTAKAHTPSVAVGSAIHKIKVRKDLMVRLITPPFFTQGDSTVLSLFLHNGTSKPQKVKTLLRVEGLRLLSSSPTDFTLAPGQEGKINYSIRAETAGTARLLALALAESGLRDAVELSVPVLPHGIEKRIVFSGESRATLSRNFLLPERIIPEATKGSVTLSGSTAGVVLQALDYLHSTYYGTSENVVGWFLPDMTVAMVFRELGITLKEIEQRLPERVVSNLQRLYRLQQEDGGWGWSDNTQSDAFWTAYVLYGLTQAPKAGYPVDETRLQRGFQWLKDHLTSIHNESDRALVLYVMAFVVSSLLGQGEREEHQSYSSLLKRECLTLAPRLKSLSDKNYGLSLLILALNQLGLKKQSSALAKVLEQRAKETSEECWWEETYPWGFYSCNPYETTGYALKALAVVNPYHPKIPKSARWLMRQRQVNGGWWSTEDTASVIYALADYLRVSEERESPNYLARVFINHHLVREISVNSTNRFNRFEVLIPRPLLKRGTNFLRLEKQGKGKLFFNGVIRYWSAEENLRPESQGLKVTRQYFLRTRSLQGNRWRESLQPVRGSVRVGDEIMVQLTIEPRADCKQVVINDPIPSGGEVIEDFSAGEERGWFARREIHDNRVTFYVDYSPKGKHNLSYILRVERKGEFHVLPTQANCLYIPEIWGTGEETRIRVR